MMKQLESLPPGAQPNGSIPPVPDDMCPVARTAEIISGKWTLLIIRDLATGTKRFSQLERSLHGISPKTLSERLCSLEHEGIIKRQTFAEVPPKVEYTLTDKGQDLVALIDTMRSYGRRWLVCDDEGK
ncbi:MAG TPA: helix-turn-helix domain-containing protein [Ktedonobacterales bacterium]|nr:helix-turn-helix domain-containing protein [Ktedonobacterales bacterium]